MFGLSFGEVLLIAVVALVAVGPQKLPGMLRSLGEWARKFRLMAHEMRAQSGIDEILRAEGVHGGLNELRGLMRGQHALPFVPPPPPVMPVSPSPDGTVSAATYATPLLDDAYLAPELDVSQEYPPEGADAYGVLPDDLFDAAPAATLADARVADGTFDGEALVLGTSPTSSSLSVSAEPSQADAEPPAKQDEAQPLEPGAGADVPALEQPAAPASSKSASV